MGKSEKLVVLSVLLVVVLLFVWSLQGGSDPDVPGSGVYASEGDPGLEKRMNGRTERGSSTQPETGSLDTNGGSAAPGQSGPMDGPGKPGASVAKAGGAPGALNPSEVLAEGEAGTSPSGSTKMLLAEIQGGSAVEISSSGSARRNGSSMADPAFRGDGEGGATSRNGVSRGRVRMQHGWDLITTAGLQGTVDPSMFLYDVTAADASWESLAKDLYGDEDKAGLLQHNNEGMDAPKGPIFVPAKDDLGRDASVRTVEVLQGESLWQVAKRTLGKGSEWKAVYEANRDVIADPDLVAPGTILKIPVR